MTKCPNCGYYAVTYNEEYDRYECYDCGYHSS